MRELLKLDFQRLFDGVLFKLALGVCAVLGIWDLVLNVQAHYANMEALKTQTIAYSYPSSVYNSCIAADGLYLPSILLFSLFPLLVTLPAGVSMAMDIKSGYIKNLRVRKEQKSVILSRYISIFAGAFLLAMAATFGQMIFSMMFLPTISPEIASYTFPMMAVGQVGHSFYAVHPFLYLLLYNLYDENHRQLHRPCVVSQDGRTATVPEDDSGQQRSQISICPCVEAGPLLPQPL